MTPERQSGASAQSSVVSGVPTDGTRKVTAGQVGLSTTIGTQLLTTTVPVDVVTFVRSS